MDRNTIKVEDHENQEPMTSGLDPWCRDKYKGVDTGFKRVLNSTPSEVFDDLSIKGGSGMRKGEKSNGSPGRDSTQ